MNWLDYVLILFLVVSALQSARRGLTREIIGLAAALAALVLGMWFYGTAGSLIRSWTSSDRVASLLGFLLIVGVVLLAGAITGRIVRGFIKAVGMSFFDRLGGALFGVIRATLIAVALLTAFLSFGPFAPPKPAPSAVVHSTIAPYLMEASGIFVDAAPMELKRSFRETYNAAKAEIQSMAHPEAKQAPKDPGTK